MNLIDAFNIINNATAGLSGTRDDHDKIKQALDAIAPLIKAEIDKQNVPQVPEPTEPEQKPTEEKKAAK